MRAHMCVSVLCPACEMVCGGTFGGGFRSVIPLTHRGTDSPRKRRERRVQAGGDRRDDM